MKYAGVHVTERNQPWGTKLKRRGRTWRIGV